MTKQIAKQLTSQWVAQVLEQFNSHTISEKEACELLVLKRARLYRLREEWLRCTLKRKPFLLHSSGQNQKRSLKDDIQKFLRRELKYLREKAYYFRGKFNFAYLSEKVEKKFGVYIHRNTIRRFAINKGFYEGMTKEKVKEED